MQGFFDFVKSLGAARMAAMAAVTLALIGFFSFLMIRMTTPQMVPLFTDLSLEDSVLDHQGPRAPGHHLSSSRTTAPSCWCRKEQVARLRMKLAESGLPKGGGVGYEIFDKSDALGATTFIQNINHLRALEGELARTIRSARPGARPRACIWCCPTGRCSRATRSSASASIVLKVRGSLEPQQVRAIRHLVATAVNGLEARARLGGRRDRQAARRRRRATTIRSAGAGADERKAAFESRLRKEVETIVSSVVGPGRARVQITADFDVNRITQTSDKFDPDGRVVRSSQTREEQSSSGDSKSGAGFGRQRIAGRRAASRTAAAAQRDQNRKTEEIVNYEISRTTKTEVIEAGRVNRISAAVLVDGTYDKNDKGEVAYKPRTKEEIDRIAALVRTAIGFDAKRGDQVEVVNLRFAETPPMPVSEPAGWMSYLQFTKDDIMRGAELGVMALLGLIVLFMVVRPLVRRIVTPEGAASRDAARRRRRPALPALPAPSARRHRRAPCDGGITVTTGGGGSITNSGGANISIVGGDEHVAISNRTSAMIDVAKVQGQVHAQSVQKVGELAEKNPHEAVSIIRSWLHEDAA